SLASPEASFEEEGAGLASSGDATWVEVEVDADDWATRSPSGSSVAVDGRSGSDVDSRGSVVSIASLVAGSVSEDAPSLRDVSLPRASASKAFAPALAARSPTSGVLRSSSAFEATDRRAGDSPEPSARGSLGSIVGERPHPPGERARTSAKIRRARGRMKRPPSQET